VTLVGGFGVGGAGDGGVAVGCDGLGSGFKTPVHAPLGKVVTLSIASSVIVDVSIGGFG